MNPIKRSLIIKVELKMKNIFLILLDHITSDIVPLFNKIYQNIFF